MQQLLELIFVLSRLFPPLTSATPPGETLEQYAFRLTQHDPYDQLILVAAKTWGLDPFLYKGLLYAESGFRVRKVNHLGAAGIAQLTPGGRYSVHTVRCRRGDCRKFTRDDALDPRKAIPAVAELLAYMQRTCGAYRMLGMYNTGRCGPRRQPFVNQVYRHVNRFRTFGGLPPASPPKPTPPRRLTRRRLTS
jgi:soluble lytic murein transglycosylase-like protein